MASETGPAWSSPDADPLGDLRRVAAESRASFYDGSLSGEPFIPPKVQAALDAHRAAVEAEAITEVKQREAHARAVLTERVRAAIQRAPYDEAGDQDLDAVAARAAVDVFVEFLRGSAGA